MSAFSYTASAKAIIFGEHSIVYKGKAIAVPVPGLSLTSSLDYSAENNIVFKKDGHAWLLDDIPDKYTSIRFVLNFFKPYFVSGVVFSTVSKIPESRGLGSSAATAFACVNCLNEACGKPLSEAEANDLATDCENIIHHRSSGLDLSTVEEGKTLAFDHDKTYEILNGLEMQLVISDTGKDKMTGRTVARVESEKSTNSNVSSALDDLAEIAEKAIEAWKEKDGLKIGALMNQAQQKLRIIGVSCSELETVISKLQEYGAIGAKLSGAGNGGIAIGLFKDVRQAEEAKEKMIALGYNSWRIQI